MRSSLKPAVFLDRDGTLIADRGHLRSPSEVVFYPDTPRALQRLQKAFHLFIVTHQPGVSGGLLSAGEVARVNAHVVAELRRHGVVISGVYCCPHRREDHCACIKPNPFFLEKAAREHGLDLTRSFVVGDHPHDVALADNAGPRGSMCSRATGPSTARRCPAAGLLVIGLLKPMGLAGGLSPEDTTRAIGGLAIGNVAGRIVWGWLYDRIGYRTIPAAVVLLCLGLGGVMAAGRSPAVFIAAGSLVGFGFGACFVLYAAQVAATHGVSQVGRLYPFLFLSYGLAGVAGPFLGGLLHDWTGRYAAALALAALVAALGARMTWRPPAAAGPGRS